MDALEQLHATQQRALAAINAGSWNEVETGLGELSVLDERALWPTLRELAVRERSLCPGREHHQLWRSTLAGGDDGASRALLVDVLARHITWTGSEVLAVLCRSLSDDRFDRMGARMAALVGPRPALRPDLATAS